MAQVPLPEGLGKIPDRGERSTARGAVNGTSAHLTEAGRLTSDQEQPSSAAALCVSLLPAPAAGVDWAALIGTARPLAGLTLMGVAATIYAAKAAKCPPALTAAVVGLELALAYLVSRAVSGSGMSARADQRRLPV